MSHTWTHEAIVNARNANENFMAHSGGTGFCLTVAVLSLDLLMKVTTHNSLSADLFPLATILPLLACFPLGKLLTYYPLELPTWLTFGHPISLGGFLPTSCDISLAIEGPHGWPCEIARFKIWLSNVAGPDGWEYLVRPERLWLHYLVIGISMLAVLAFFAFYPWIGPWLREMAKQQSRDKAIAAWTEIEQRLEQRRAADRDFDKGSGNDQRSKWFYDETAERLFFSLESS